MGRNDSMPRRMSLVRLVLLVGTLTWMLVAVPVSIFLRWGTQFLPLGRFLAGVLKLGDEWAVSIARVIQAFDVSLLVVSAIALALSLRFRRLLDLGLAALGALFMGLLITFFTLKNLADAGLYADLINAIKVRDWIAFAGLLTLVAAIKILVVVEDRED